jgi:DNA-binding LacI/PurR family transcriptional regulator
MRAVHGAGREALRLLLCAINAPAEPPQRVTLMPQLILHESTATAPERATRSTSARTAAST